MVVYSAVNMALDHLHAVLTQKMTTEVLDDTKVTELRPGKLQEDPTAGAGLNILIYAPHENMKIELETTRESKKSGMDSPTFLVGGGAFYNMPFELKFVLHFKGEQNRDVARSKAWIVFSRAKSALLQMGMPVNPNSGLPEDDFHEALHLCVVQNGYLNEGGGPGHFIWRGILHFYFVTEQLTREYLLED